METNSENNESQNPASVKTKRRDFFAVGMRCIIVGGIGSFAAMQEFKRQRLANDPNCIKLDTCRECIELSSGCKLDKAENFRADQQGSK